MYVHVYVYEKRAWKTCLKNVAFWPANVLEKRCVSMPGLVPFLLSRAPNFCTISTLFCRMYRRFCLKCTSVSSEFHTSICVDLLRISTICLGFFVEIMCCFVWISYRKGSWNCNAGLPQTSLFQLSLSVEIVRQFWIRVYLDGGGASTYSEVLASSLWGVGRGGGGLFPFQGKTNSYEFASRSEFLGEGMVEQFVRFQRYVDRRHQLGFGVEGDWTHHMDSATDRAPYLNYH